MCYAARNAVLPSISGFGTSIGAVVGGSLLTEQVFSYPGVGQMLLQAVTSNDYALMQGIFLIITVTVLVVNLSLICFTALSIHVRGNRIEVKYVCNKFFCCCGS